MQVRADLVSAGAWERTLMLVVRALPAPAPPGTHLSVAPDRLAHIGAGTRPHPRRDSQIRHGLDLSKYDVTRTRAFPLTGEHVRPKSHLQEQPAVGSPGFSLARRFASARLALNRSGRLVESRGQPGFRI